MQRMKRKKRRTLPLLLLASVISGGCAEKPVLEVIEAQQALASARDAEADFFAPEDYDLAVSNLDSALEAIDAQDAERLWARNYDVALYLLDLSIDQSMTATETANSIRLDTAFEVEQILPTVQETIDSAFVQLRDARGTNVVSLGEVEQLNGDLVLATRLLEEAQESEEAADFVAALEKSQRAIDLAETVRTRSEEINAYALEVQLELERQAIPPVQDLNDPSVP
jgi:hypothetical protein